MEIILYFILGLAFLIKGADIFVDGSASLAWRLGVSRLVIGLTVVSMGTSAPELVVNLIAAFSGNSDIAVGNIIGSNIANLLLILGVAAILSPVHISYGTAWKEIPYSLFAVLILYLAGNHSLGHSPTIPEISRANGIFLMLFFLLFLYYVLRMARSGREETAQVKQLSGLLSVVYIFFGLAGLILGGRWFVYSAVEMAKIFGLSEAVIGLTVVAIGTSLPELAVSVAAASKKHSDIVIGNVIGSNIFNIFWVLGLTAVIHPLAWNPKINFDLAVCAVATLLLTGFCLTGKKYCMEKWEGGVFFLSYCTYLAFLIIGDS